MNVIPPVHLVDRMSHCLCYYGQTMPLSLIPLLYLSRIACLFALGKAHSS